MRMELPFIKQYCEIIGDVLCLFCLVMACWQISMQITQSAESIVDGLEFYLKYFSIILWLLSIILEYFAKMLLQNMKLYCR